MKMQLVRVGVEYQTHSSQYKYYDTSILLLIPERVLVALLKQHLIDPSPSI